MIRSWHVARLIVGASCGLAVAIACGGEAQTAASTENETGGKAAAADQEASDAKPGGQVSVEASGASGAIGAIDQFISEQKIDKSSKHWKTGLKKPPELEFDSGDTYYWELVTNVGPISIKLMPEVAPMHVSSTLYLTRLGFFDGLTFHRIIPGFMAQGGDPLGNGRGSPGYRFDGEFDRGVRHDRPGLLSQANAGPGTDGSQFFITFVPTAHLDGKHTLYGEVVAGMETVKELEAWRQRGSPHLNEPLLIESATIRVE